MTEFEILSSNSSAERSVHLPELSFTVLRKGAKAELPAETESDDLVLENQNVRYVFSPDARLIEATDKLTGSSILKPGESRFREAQQEP